MATIFPPRTTSPSRYHRTPSPPPSFLPQPQLSQHQAKPFKLAPPPKKKLRMSSSAAAAAAPSKRQQAAREVVDILHEISTLLNTHLDRNALSLCVSLVENGVNPEALATVIKELRRESENLREAPEAMDVDG
ncbi:mitotic-spindle organizing gamma-tubulin ring associated-domain-containing protein [Morchella snyderi]|nr:mitotic-spindle organizing gamma-tubulin ring associated-domain-containing protein [Morchella snyderi]